MDRRYRSIVSLAIILAIALYFWLRPEQTVTPVVPDSPSAASSVAPPPIAPQPASPDKAHPVPPALYVLAISWFPGFCEQQPSVPECLHPASGVFTRFALHGLWPNDSYCGVSDARMAADRSGRWDLLPAPELSDDTWNALKAVMPGTRSHLERHEWVEHGSCAGVDADLYFRRATTFVNAINATPVRDLFVARGAGSMTAAEIRTAFDKAFGAGAGKRVRVNCERLDGHDTITELTINLYGDAFGPTPLGKLIADAHPRSAGCPEGLVDR